MSWKNSYRNLIEQSFDFPQEEFDLQDGFVTFNGVSIKNLIEKYGTPLRLFYLPKVGEQIEKVRTLFNRAIQQNNYSGSYEFCYCTKCNHFEHVVSEALRHSVHLETSSAFDIELILNLHQQGKLNNNRVIVHNGYKTDNYLKSILKLMDAGFSNCVIVLDGAGELQRLKALNSRKTLKIGIRMAIEEEPQSSYYTSRLGIPAGEMLDFYNNHLKNDPQFELKMFHFFVDTGIKDTLYYWGEFQKAVEFYIEMAKTAPYLDSFNIGGGFPIKNKLGFEYDYEYIINEIVKGLKSACESEQIKEPNIFTEFGKYTVGESGAIIFKVLEQKQQNDSELWYIIDNSLMNTIPDAWTIHEKFTLLPLNKWDNEYARVSIGGISCDHYDYYNYDDLNQQIHLPTYDEKEKEPLYLGFFHTGAYQDSISGYGGIKHCLIPSPKYIVIDRDEEGNLIDYMYRTEQSAEDMFRILGYNQDSN